MHKTIFPSDPAIIPSPVPLLPDPIVTGDIAETVPAPQSLRETIEGIVFYGVFGLGIAFPLFAFVWVAITG